MSENPFSLWVYLSQSPLLWLTVTLLVYATADAASLATHRHPLANPVLHSIWIIGAFLVFTGTSYTTYFNGRRPEQEVHELRTAEIGRVRRTRKHQERPDDPDRMQHGIVQWMPMRRQRCRIRGRINQQRHRQPE